MLARLRRPPRPLVRRLVLIAGALMLVLGVILVGYEALRLLDQPPARPAEAGQALS